MTVTNEMDKVSFQEARALILEKIPVLESELKEPLKALGQVSAERVGAGINVPDWDASALDGFALKSGDIQAANADRPVYLKVIGRVTAGQSVEEKIVPGTAIRIMTGAPIPAGADCVLGFEDTTEFSGEKRLKKIGIMKAVASGRNIRRAGDQIKKSSVVLEKGQTLGPGEIGLLASLGLNGVKVIRRPVVAIIATGEELLLPGQLLEPAKIFCGNASALAAQVVRYGGIAKILNIARDRPGAVRQQIRRALQFDIIVTIGGSAMGDRDLVKEIMAEMGKVVFSRIEMNPGKSTAFGLIRKEGENGLLWVPHFALSGNPTAAMLSFEALVRPAILKSRGLEAELETDTAQAVQEFANPGGKTRLVWASVQSQEGLFVVYPAASNGQGVLPSIAAANAIAIIPAEIPMVKVGKKVQVMPLEWR